MKKIITISITSLFLFFVLSSYNTSNAKIKIEDAISTLLPDSQVEESLNPSDYDPSNGGLSASDKNAIKKKTGIILGWLRNISVIVSVIAIMVVGLKYILASVDERAKYKETLIPIVIGAIMAISGTTIVSFIYENI